MNGFDFAAAHPVLAVILALIFSSVVVAPFQLAFRIYNRRVRSRNIAARGWPPAHLDADGDFKGDE